MDDARQALDEQRQTMALALAGCPEADRIEAFWIPSQWHKALREVLDYADVLEKHGDLGRNVYYAEVSIGIRRRVLSALTANPSDAESGRR